MDKCVPGVQIVSTCRSSLAESCSRSSAQNQEQRLAFSLCVDELQSAVVCESRESGRER